MCNLYVLIDNLHTHLFQSFIGISNETDTDATFSFAGSDKENILKGLQGIRIMKIDAHNVDGVSDQA